MKKIIAALIVIGLIGIFYKFGRSIYIPILNKFKNTETVDSISNKIKLNVEERLKIDLQKNGFKSYPSTLVLAAFKEEQILEVYGENESGLKLFKTYGFTAFSGEIGPKLKEGDKQIPEGIYKIEYLNPNSSYHLSMKINYPNDFDKKKGVVDNRKNLGGDIFIHGKSVTIGCIPIGDEAIEELFFLSEKALDLGIKVIISPKDFRISSDFPKIEAISWEKELYKNISKELIMLPEK